MRSPRGLDRLPRICGSFCLAYLLILVVAFASPSVVHGEAEPPSSSQSQPTTTSDATLEVDRLQVLLRPLSKAELEIELDGWLDLLRAKIRAVGALEIEIKDLPADADSTTLTEKLVAMRTAETNLAERARHVLEALRTKGGDVTTAEQYIDAVTDIVETTDSTSRGAAIIAGLRNWIRRDDGGILYLRRGLLAVIILVMFWMISKIAGRIIANALARHPRASSLLENFARRTTGGVVMVIGLLMALAAVGVEIGPMMAALGAGGFIVGFALQETLGSFASGLMIMVYRPFDVDDYVAVSGVEGTVKEMSLVSTTLLTVDNKVLVIPNKKAWGDTITNFTGRDSRRVDLVFGIGYSDNIQHATEVLEELASAHPLVLSEPALTVKVDELGDSSVNIFCRPWVKTSDYWAVHWDLTRQVKERFDAEGISFPFPQRDVHMIAEPVSH